MDSIQAFHDYLALEKKYSKHTVSAYLKDLEQFIFFLKSESGNSINQTEYLDIRCFVSEMLDKNISARSANRKISSLKAYFKFLKIIGEIEVNPLATHKSLKNSNKLQVVFSKKEVEQVLQMPIDSTSFKEVRDQLIVELLYATGMRRAELISLELKSIDLENRILKVLGKRNKERFIPLLQSTLDKISIYMNLRSDVVSMDCNYFLVTSKGNRIGVNHVYKIVTSYFKTVSSKVKVSPHILRHSFATHLLDNGADLNAVKELLGHSSLASTQVYTHTSMQMLKDVYNKSHPRS